MSQPRNAHDANAPTAKVAYAAYRGRLNAERRVLIGALVCVITAFHALVLPLLDTAMNQPLPTGQSLLLPGYLFITGLVGLALGRQPLPLSPRARQWLDDGWVAMLLAGAALVATQNAQQQVQDLSTYALLCLPAAIFHAAGRRHIVVLQSLAWLGAVLGMLAAGLDLGHMLPYLLSLAAVSATGVYVGVQLEETRQREHLTAHALARSHRELEARSRELGEANARFAQGNLELELRTAELSRLNGELAAHSAAIEDANRQLERLAMTDPLTGMANRRHLFEALDREFTRSRRYHNELSIAIIDLDDFGRLNKTHGVLTGDEVLSELARLVRDHLRGVDLVARYGGEEFVVVLPDSTLEAAHRLMDRVRELIAHTPLGSQGIRITFSAGIARLTAADADPIAVLHRADAALRRAKAAGKNQVLVADDHAAAP